MEFKLSHPDDNPVQPDLPNLQLSLNGEGCKDCEEQASIDLKLSSPENLVAGINTLLVLTNGEPLVEKADLNLTLDSDGNCGCGTPQKSNVAVVWSDLQGIPSCMKDCGTLAVTIANQVNPLITTAINNATNYLTSYVDGAVSASITNANNYTDTAVSGLVPKTRSITINGNTQDLAADRSWTITIPTYVLPTASASTLGGIKVGSGLAINGSGVLSATYSYSLPTASPTTLGGIKVGSGLAINAFGVLSATYIYDLPVATAVSLGGVMVGAGLAIDGDGVLSATYALPIATSTILGGVKIGSGLSMTLDGTLSATYSYTLPVASATTLGGIKVGAGLAISAGVLSVTFPTIDWSTLTGKPNGGEFIYNQNASAQATSNFWISGTGTAQSYRLQNGSISWAGSDNSYYDGIFYSPDDLFTIRTKNIMYFATAGSSKMAVGTSGVTLLSTLYLSPAPAAYASGGYDILVRNQGNATMQLVPSTTFAAASGSGSYIQNQQAVTQTANFVISGLGIASSLTAVATGAGIGGLISKGPVSDNNWSGWLTLQSNDTTSVNFKLYASVNGTFFDYNGVTRMIFTPTGLTGIGTLNPESYLAGVQGVAVYDGSYSGISLATPTHYHILFTRESTGAFEMYQGGTGNVLTVHNGGNVGIGTSVNSGYKLDVAGTGRFTNNVTVGGQTNSHYILFDSYSTPSMGLLQWTNTDIYLRNNYVGGNIYLGINGSNVGAMLTTAGNFLVGSITDAGYRLDVSGTGRFSGLLTVAVSSTSGIAASITKTQTAPNASDAGDGVTSLSYILSASSATNELVTRTFSLGNTNQLTGGGVVQNLRVFNLVNSTVAGSSTTDMDCIYIENGTAAGTVTNYRGVLIRSYQGDNRAAFVAEAITGGTNSTYVLLGTRSIPSGVWGIYAAGGEKSYHAGNWLLGGTTDSGYKLNVTGTTLLSGTVTMSALNDSTGVARMVTVTNGVLGFTTIPPVSTLSQVLTAGSTAASDIEITDPAKGLILTAGGVRYRITVTSGGGSLTITAL